MNALLNRLFGLGTDSAGDQSLGFGSPDAQLTFVHPLPAWTIVLIVLVIAAAVWWSYRGLPGARSARAGLAALRAVALTILFVLALGPRIEQTTIRTEADWAMVLLDRSASITTRDAIDPGSQSLISRAEQMGRMLAEGRAAWDELGDEKRVVWMGFGERASVLSTGSVPEPIAGDEPASPSTSLGGAIRAALDEAAARPVSSIVIASDGRSFDTIDPELINELVSAQIPIIAVPLGSAEPVRDLGIAQVEHPDAVFGEDIVPIRVRLSASGFDGADLLAAGARLELVDHATGRVLESAPIEARHLDDGDDGADGEESGQWLSLMHTPRGEGERRLDVRIALDGAAEGPGRAGDLNPTNDETALRFTIVERPMRVLYIDGYPRWEHRYLKNLLLREPSIVSSSLLLSASRRYIQEGDELIASVPASAEEWEPFDVVILGDVRAEMFSRQQLTALLNHVTERGAGVLWIAGPAATPSGWGYSALSPLLPMRADAAGSQPSVQAWDTPVTMSATDEARRLGVLGLNDDRTGWLDRLSDPATGWSRLQWALALDESGFKPGVGVLARAQTIDGSDEAPIVTMMRYGAGRSIFVGTDEIWRWRYGRGEDLPERFWLPLIRSLGRGTVERRAAPASIVVTPQNPTPGDPAQVTLRLFDQSVIESMPERVTVEIVSASAADEPLQVVLRGSGDSRIGTWVPDQPGNYAIAPEGLDLSLAGIRAEARVLDRSDERRLLDTDHALLASLAEQTGGAVVAPADFAVIPQQLPNRTRTIASPPQRASLWDRPIVLIVLISLFTAEWIGRRILRLA
ncbi:MAG: vWA domain-containing protein [Phycisphaerales bacterium]